MNNVIDNRVHEAGNLGLKVIETTENHDAEDKKLAGIISNTILTNRGRGHDVIDPYQIAQTFRRNERRRFMPPDSEGDR